MRLSFLLCSFFIVLALLVGCEKSEVTQPIEMGPKATINATALLCNALNDPTCQVTSPLGSAVVYLYQSEHHKLNEDHISRKLTDLSGRVSFNDITPEVYLLVLVHQGQKYEEQVNAPANTISWVEWIVPE